MEGISWKMEKLKACGWKVTSTQNAPDYDSHHPPSSVAPDDAFGIAQTPPTMIAIAPDPASPS
eukprot:3164162-Rhodomonas_salina.1